MNKAIHLGPLGPLLTGTCLSLVLMASSALGQQSSQAVHSPTPHPSRASQRSGQPSGPPRLLPLRDNSQLRFVDHEESPEPLIHLDAPQSTISLAKPTRNAPRVRAHVNPNNLQSLSRDIEQTLQADEEAFGTLMSEVDELADVIRRQKAHKEQIQREKEEAEARANAIQQELRNAKKEAIEARRQAEKLLRDQEELAAEVPKQASEPPVDHHAPKPMGPHFNHPLADSHPTQSNPPAEGSQPADVTPGSQGAGGDHPLQAKADPADEAQPPPGLAVDPPPKAVTPAAVDRQSLADSLFGTGEYRLALATYRQLIREENGSAEKSIWLRFQTANCYRHLGELQRAETYYREVAADRRDVFISGMAKWWLEHLEERKKLAARIEKWKLVASQIENAEKM